MQNTVNYTLSSTLKIPKFTILFPKTGNLNIYSDFQFKEKTKDNVAQKANFLTKILLNWPWGLYMLVCLIYICDVNNKNYQNVFS